MTVMGLAADLEDYAGDVLLLGRMSRWPFQAEHRQQHVQN